MVFSSLIFLYAFFPLSLAAAWLCRSKPAQNRALLVFSLIFYGFGAPKYLLLLMAMAFADWLCALGVEQGRHKKTWLALAVVVDIGMIAYFKYAAFLVGIFTTPPKWVTEIVLPIGISFYTFQLLTYVVDVYRGEAPAQKRYWNVLLYAALYHQCIAGPIVRYQTVSQELFGPEPRKPEIAAGVSRFAVGLGKKVLLANPCGALTQTMILSESAAADISQLSANLARLEGTSVLGSWLGILAYALHIYLDFSAYSDMAIGMGQMMGLHYMENFNYPYLSPSVTEFWRRWHISLGTFFRDYVYIPLGGSRCAPLRVVFNTFVVWLLTGLWHGASWNYVLWGLWFFLLLMLERYVLRNVLKKLPVLSHLYLLLAVCLGWVIFRFNRPELIRVMLGRLFGVGGNLWDMQAWVQLKTNVWLLLAACIGATPLVHTLNRRITAKLPETGAARKLYHILVYGLFPAALLLASTACLVGDSFNPFIYFQF